MFVEIDLATGATARTPKILPIRSRISGSVRKAAEPGTLFSMRELRNAKKGDFRIMRKLLSRVHGAERRVAARKPTGLPTRLNLRGDTKTGPPVVRIENNTRRRCSILSALRWSGPTVAPL
ncbi:hypothetical protein [Bradyrhizobium sp. CCGUVB23]|uniref:hypothetical protein n=1 Tax=Bradyrhizobium sp. CCGUVB23 TaxID=2949630 RepID=UPI0020B255AC|nr:hypothetical protein [Bradyrhizobium sp. CCGUVB23]MCP3459747.1 hypothetical protein [Bradyrhizobium sp. CCGUVB23]